MSYRGAWLPCPICTTPPGTLTQDGRVYAVGWVECEACKGDGTEDAALIRLRPIKLVRLVKLACEPCHGEGIVPCSACKGAKEIKAEDAKPIIADYLLRKGSR